MPEIPSDIPGLGPSSQAPRQNPQFDPMRDAPSFTSEDYFMWTRVDGVTSLRQLILMSGSDAQHAVAVLTKLREHGALLLGDETPAQVGRRARPKRAEAGAPSPPPAAGAADLAELGELSPDEEAALAAEVDLSLEEKLRILATLRLVADGDLYGLLGVPEDVDRRQLKRAYFRLSKEFHPDRYYNRQVALFRPWLALIFETANHALAVLSDERQRARYLAERHGRGAVATTRSQTPEEHAEELFERACAAEVSGDRPGALRYFAAAVRVDPKSRYLRRAASCALDAGELKTAEEYAKQAADLEPKDPSLARLVGAVLRAEGKLREAEQTLERAVGLKTENDVLAGEIARDLAAVRELLAGGASR